jgi:hypothetical protein
MDSAITFVEFENQVISATYRKLMAKAIVVVVDKETGHELTEPTVRLASSTPPNGSVRLRLPATFRPGTYYLRALNERGEQLAQSLPFRIA